MRREPARGEQGGLQMAKERRGRKIMTMLKLLKKRTGKPGEKLEIEDDPDLTTESSQDSRKKNKHHTKERTRRNKMERIKGRLLYYR